MCNIFLLKLMELKKVTKRKFQYIRLNNQVHSSLVEIEGNDIFRNDTGSRGCGVGIYVLSIFKATAKSGNNQYIFRQNIIIYRYVV